MVYSPLTLSRRHVLGSFYGRSEPIDSVPVYLDDPLGERLGFARESLEGYSDSLTFHISEENCKGLASGRIACSFAYDFSERRETDLAKTKRRIRVTCFLLVTRQTTKASAVLPS